MNPRCRTASARKRYPAVFCLRSGLLAVALCFSCASFAQQKPTVDTAPAAAPPAANTPPGKPAQPSAAANDFSKEALVFDRINTRIREESDGTGTRQTTGRVRILADAGVKDMAVLQFTYTASNQQVDIAYVRVIKPDGSVILTPPYNVQDLPADVTRTAPMYSDIHQKHVAVKGLGVGDTLEYQVTLTTLKPEVPGHFWFEYSFQKDLIILDEQVDLDLPADKQATVASADIQPTITTAAGRKLYHWKSSNLARPDPDAPPKSLKHWKPSIQVTTFSSWDQVGAWYQSLQRESIAVTPAIQDKAAALTKGLTTDEEKTRAIFNDVALHVHYVGLEFGIGRYKPHPADDVLSNEYGDCKDKHTLLAAELKAVGIQAWPVLISASRELDPATPSPAQFNHVITLVPLGGKLLWMDSTEEVAPIETLTATLRDKQALAIPDSKPAYLEHTPVDLPFVQSARFQADGKLSDQGVFTGHIVQTYHGDVELFLRSVLRLVPQSQLKQYLQGFSNATGFVGDVSNPQISDVEQISLPLQFSYDYTREKFGEWGNHRISAPMPPAGWELSPGVKQPKPADDVEIGSPGDQVYVTTVTVPKGWFMMPPNDVSLKEDWAEYHASYSFKDGVFTAERRLVTKKNKVPLADWDKYLEFRRSIYADEIQMSVLQGDANSQHFVDGLTHPGQVSRFGISEELRQKILLAMKPWHEASSTLLTDPPPTTVDIQMATDKCRQMVSDAEVASRELGVQDPFSLYWQQVLASAWTCLGWAEFESKERGAAEIYLRAAWTLSQSKMSGFQLARVLEAKGAKAEAARQYELASVSNVDPMLDGPLFTHTDLNERIAAGYTRVTGKPLTATLLNHGSYNGSLRADLDKGIEIRPLLHSTSINGQAYFLVAFERGKPTKATWMSGDTSLKSLLPVIQAHTYIPVLPEGSKARLLRELRVVCSQWAGCDAELVLPTSIQIPVQPTTVVAQPRSLPNAKTAAVVVAPQ